MEAQITGTIKRWKQGRFLCLRSPGSCDELDRASSKEGSRSPKAVQKSSLVNGLIQSYHQRDGNPCFTAGFFRNSWLIRAFKLKCCPGTATVVQWLRVCLPGEGGTDWESSAGIYTLPCAKQTAGGKLLCHTGTQPGALWQLKGAGRGGRQEVGSRGREHNYDWFTLTYGRNHHHTVKSLSSN